MQPKPPRPQKLRHILTGMFLMAALVSFGVNYLYVTGRIASAQYAEQHQDQHQYDAIAQADANYGKGGN